MEMLAEPGFLLTCATFGFGSPIDRSTRRGISSGHGTSRQSWFSMTGIVAPLVVPAITMFTGITMLRTPRHTR
jgi:hypothetical protein